MWLQQLNPTKMAARKKPGSINGGFFQKSNDKPDQYPSVVIVVDDRKKVKEAGGELLGEPVEILEWDCMCLLVIQKETA
jgi:hypothetical protein